MHLLTRTDTADFAAWKTAFDSDAEGRRDAGLSVLQIWREKDAPATVWVLLDVNDRKKAERYLDTQTALHGGGATHHFVETL